MTAASDARDPEQLVAHAWLAANGYGAEFRDAIHPDA